MYVECYVVRDGLRFCYYYAHACHVRLLLNMNRHVWLNLVVLYQFDLFNSARHNNVLSSIDNLFTETEIQDNNFHLRFRDTTRGKYFIENLK